MTNSISEDDTASHNKTNFSGVPTSEQHKTHIEVTLKSFSEWKTLSEKPTGKMTLYVDDREPNSVQEIARGVSELTDVHFEIRRLPLGDFLIIDPHDEAIVVERKTIFDFFNSVRSNHLWQQLLDILKNGYVLNHPIRRCMLLVQGVPSEFYENIPHDIRKNDISALWNQVSGAIQEVLFVYNIPIVPIENYQDALKSFLEITISREKQGKNNKSPHGRWRRKPKGIHLPEKNLKHYALASIPLIGEKLAETLLKHFKTIQCIANATLKDLQAVHGIGKKKAEKIHNIFH